MGAVSEEDATSTLESRLKENMIENGVENGGNIPCAKSPEPEIKEISETLFRTDRLGIISHWRYP